MSYSYFPLPYHENKVDRQFLSKWCPWSLEDSCLLGLLACHQCPSFVWFVFCWISKSWRRLDHWRENYKTCPAIHSVDDLCLLSLREMDSDPLLFLYWSYPVVRKKIDVCFFLCVCVCVCVCVVCLPAMITDKLIHILVKRQKDQVARTATQLIGPLYSSSHAFLLGELQLLINWCQKWAFRRRQH